MRFLGRTAIVLTTGVVAIGLAVGQQPQRGGFGGGFGGRGGAGGMDPAALLNNDSVRKELKLTDEQLAKVPDAVLKALGDVLSPDQMKRLQQITIQVRGYQALTDPKVQTALKMTDEQKDNLKTIVADAQKEMREMFQGGGGGKGGFGQNAEKIATLRKETTEKAMGVLNAGQKKMWQEMTGEEFKMQFGPAGGGGRKKKNKTDAE